MVCKSFLKKVALPFAAVTTFTLMNKVETAKASTLSDDIFQKSGPLLYDFSGKRSNDFSILDFPKQVIHNIELITGKLLSILDWLNNLPVSIPKYSADLLISIYTFLTKIALQTPLFIFDNPFLKSATLTFSLVSISIVTLLTIGEAFMQMLKKKHTDFKKILKRYAIVVAASGFMPMAFKTGFTYLNELSTAISNMGGVNGGNLSGLITGVSMGYFDTLIIILFDLSLIALLIPACFQAGVRWWDLFCLVAISPVALSCFVFDRHQHYFYTWWNRVKSLSMIQLVYSVYILMMGVFIFSTQAVSGGIFTLMCKLLIVGAGLYRLSNPPRFVSNMTGAKTDVIDSMQKGKKSAKDIFSILTFKDPRYQPLKGFVGKLFKKKPATP